MSLPAVADAPAVQTPAKRTSGRGRICRRDWSYGKTLVAVTLMAAAVYAARDAWADIIHIARRDEEQSHVFLVPMVVAWLLWVRRERLRSYEPTARWVGPAAIAVGWAMNWVGDRYLVQSFWHFGAILMVIGGLLAVAGGGLIPRLLPVFAALLFMVPVPGRIRQAIALPLQTHTADITRKVLETLGVSDIVQSGNMITVNHHDVMIAEACNGLRMVFALVMVSYAFAYGTPLRQWFRVLIVVVSPISAIAFNVARLIPTVWATGFLDAATANAFHDVSGWLMLPCAFFTLLGLMRLLRWAQIPITPYVLAYGAF